jgi:hypothetical protein
MEKEKYIEEGAYPKNDTQILLEQIFSKNFYFEGYDLTLGKDEILEFKDTMYEWFEIHKKGIKNRLCFGFWDASQAQIRWFIDKDEVDIIKSKLKPKN